MKNKNLPTQPGSILFHEKSGSFAVLSSEKVWFVFDFYGMFTIPKIGKKEFQGYKLLKDVPVETIYEHFNWIG